MKNQLYHFIDTYEYDDSDLTFLIVSNAEVGFMKDVERVANAIWLEDDMPKLSKTGFELYHKYYEEYVGCSKIEIIESIVKEEGYSWESPDVVDIEW